MRTLIIISVLSVAACTGERNSQWSEAGRSGAGEDQTFTTPDGKVTTAKSHTVSHNHGFSLADSDISPGKRVSEVYTGKALIIDDSCFSWSASSLSKNYMHLSMMLQQSTLLSLYAPPGKAEAWHQGVIKSLEETDSEGVHRPTTPVTEQAVRRLSIGATSANSWVLNAVRFRPREKPMQIKINYELDMQKVAADKSIASAHIIHSIAIPENLEADFLKAMRGIPQDQVKSGCYVYRMLGYFLQKGSYFFWHSNIFDTKPDVNEWRFAEAKVVANDKTNEAVVAGPHDIKPGTAKEGDVLRIVRMSFPYFNSDETGKLTQTNDPPLLLWFSGNKTDLNTKPGFNLLKNVATSDDLHPGRKHDAAFTCGQCHIRRSGAIVDPMTNKLTRQPSMVVRHIGFGDGGNCEKEPLFGFPRAYNRASLSSFLLEDADAREFYGYSTTNTRPYISPEACLEPRLEVKSEVETPCNFDGYNWKKKLKFTVTNRNLRPIPIGWMDEFGSGMTSGTGNTCSNQTIGIDASCQFSVDFYYTQPTNNLAGAININSESFSRFPITKDHGDNSCVPPAKVDADVAIVESEIQACNYDDPYYTSKKLRYTVTNNDSYPLYLRDMNSEENGWISTNTCNNNTMQPGSSCYFDIQYYYTTPTNTTNIPLNHGSPYFNSLKIDKTVGDNSCPILDKVDPEVSITQTVVENCTDQGMGGYKRKKLRFDVVNNDEYPFNFQSVSSNNEEGWISTNTCSNVAVGASCYFEADYYYTSPANTLNLIMNVNSQYFNSIKIGTETGDNSCPN